MFQFQAYGLSIGSVLRLQGHALSNMSEPTAPDDVHILYGDVSPTGFDAPVEQGLFYQVKPDGLWLNVPNIARFWVDSGARIVIDPHPGVHEDSLMVFIAGPCMAALLMQRDLFVLNGSVFKVHDHAAAFIGQSGSGKSSLLALMMQRGHLLLADGLCVVNKEGFVFPGLRQIDLWLESATLLNIDTKALQATRPGLKKYHVPMNALFYKSSLLLKNVYALHPQKNQTLHATYLSGSDKIKFLQKNIYNTSYKKTRSILIIVHVWRVNSVWR